MSTDSAFPAAAMQASKAALDAALSETDKPEEKAETTEVSKEKSGSGDLEDGEIQEVDMEAQADAIRTVLHDPTNFNAIVSHFVEIAQIFNGT